MWDRHKQNSNVEEWKQLYLASYPVWLGKMSQIIYHENCWQSFIVVWPNDKPSQLHCLSKKPWYYIYNWMFFLIITFNRNLNLVSLFLTLPLIIDYILWSTMLETTVAHWPLTFVFTPCIVFTHWVTIFCVSCLPGNGYILSFFPPSSLSHLSKRRCVERFLSVC